MIRSAELAPRVLRRLAQGAILIAALCLLAFALRCDGPWFEKHVFLPQQFLIAANRSLGSYARVLAAIVAVPLLLAIPSLPRRASARALLVTALATLVAAEVLLQWRMRRLVRPELAADMEALTVPDPRYGRTFAPGIDRFVPTSGRAIRYRTDSAGRRIAHDAPDPALSSLVFTGESTVAGIGLRWDETFPAILGQRLHLQAVNLASPNYRADQSWLRLKDALPALERPVAVIGIFRPGLIGRSFAAGRHPGARPSAASGVELLPPPAPDLLQHSGIYQLWRHLYWSDAAFEEGLRSTAAVLADMAALARARGAPCVFLVTGHTPPPMVREIFADQGLDYVVAEVPPGELLSDGHPGPRGSLRLAEALERRLRTFIANR